MCTGSKTCNAQVVKSLPTAVFGRL